MEIEVTETTTKPSNPYPYFGKSKRNNTVVFFTDTNTGIVISSEEKDMFAGYFSLTLTEDNFYPLKSFTVNQKD